ncbi:HTH myb-type domain-containing protein [Entamoeba marina]
MTRNTTQLINQMLSLWDEQEKELQKIFSVTNKQINATPKMNSKPHNRYWSEEEHIRFLVCILYLKASKCKGLPINCISKYVKTRSSIQVRTHAQKYFSEKKMMMPHTDPIVQKRLENDITF